ncbi:MAG: hypothetical protein JNM39_11120 [Bdellovibrionaceae bacterium]|nr:hypothetical protein [Pseudobdellovibrionaceae bacterium]
MRFRPTFFLVSLLGYIFVSSCSMKSSKSNAPASPPAPQPPAPVAQTQAGPTTPATSASVNKASQSHVAQAQEMEIKLKNNIEKVVPEKPLAEKITQPNPGSITTPPKHHREVGPISAEKSLGWLKNGNIRFTKANFRNDGVTKLDRERLSTGQKPHAVVLSCSDSRVPPEIVFDQKLGEIFTIRTAGQNPDSAVIASLEYAIEHLGTNLIVVMGHESCGAVKAAALAGPDEKLGSPFLERLVSQIKARLEPSRKTTSPRFVQEGWENVNGVTQELLKKSEIVREAIESGSVKIQPALYHLASGQVEWAPNSVK